MSIRLMSKVWELAVDADTRDILMALADHANDNGDGVRPSIGRLAWKIGKGIKNKNGEYPEERTVQRRIKDLLKIKALTLTRIHGRGRANEYHLDLSVFPIKPEFEPKGDNLSPVEKGDKLRIKGDKLSQKGDTLVSPEPSIEPSIESKQVQAPIILPFASEKSTTELWHEITSASLSDVIPDTGLNPILPEEKYLFDALNIERDARHYAPLVRFKTTKQRDKFRQCVTYFNGSTNLQIDEIIANGKRDIEAVVNALHYRLKHSPKPVPSYAAPNEQFVRPNLPVVDMSRVIIR